jgi:hypothetical protein
MISALLSFSGSSLLPLCVSAASARCSKVLPAGHLSSSMLVGVLAGKLSRKKEGKREGRKDCAMTWSSTDIRTKFVDVSVLASENDVKAFSGGED